MAMIEQLCTEDWIEIAGSSETCGDGININKYCGNWLSTDTAGVLTANSVICGEYIEYFLSEQDQRNL